MYQFHEILWARKAVCWVITHYRCFNDPLNSGGSQVISLMSMEKGGRKQIPFYSRSTDFSMRTISMPMRITTHGLAPPRLILRRIRMAMNRTFLVKVTTCTVLIWVWNDNALNVLADGSLTAPNSEPLTMYQCNAQLPSRHVTVIIDVGSTYNCN